MLFNIMGILIFVWTVPLFEKLLIKQIPDQKIKAEIILPLLTETRFFYYSSG